MRFRMKIMDIIAEKYYDDNLENYNLLNKIDPMTAKQAMEMMEEYHQAKLKLLGIGDIDMTKSEIMPDFLYEDEGEIRIQWDGDIVTEEWNDYLEKLGMPFTENYDKRTQLFMEASNRGFFDDDNYFTPVDNGWTNTAYFKHHYSPIASNYEYDEKTETLRISAIGVKRNFSSCRVAIYKEGKWAELKNDK
jgi:hypothetical protein